jgi:hypothetical protein
MAIEQFVGMGEWVFHSAQSPMPRPRLVVG